MAMTMIRLQLAALAPMHRQALDAGTGWLTREEATRLAAMASRHRQSQFLAGHWLVRVLAARHAGGEAAHWQWSRPDDAPASLLRDDRRVFASLSHSGDWLAAAVGDEALGIDIEAAPKPRDFLAMAERVFSPDECAGLHASPDDLAPAFHRHWTIKEATGKRDGRGLRMEVSRRQVPVAVGVEDPRNTIPVVPSKAGTQRVDLADNETNRSPKHWVPAFAGMTEGGGNTDSGGMTEGGGNTDSGGMTEGGGSTDSAGMAGSAVTVETWQHGDLVLALAHTGCTAIDAKGLPSAAHHARWRIRNLD